VLFETVLQHGQDAFVVDAADVGRGVAGDRAVAQLQRGIEDPAAGAWRSASHPTALLPLTVTFSSTSRRS
jgi:hypothetical protein